MTKNDKDTIAELMQEIDELNWLLQDRDDQIDQLRMEKAILEERLASSIHVEPDSTEVHSNKKKPWEI